MAIIRFNRRAKFDTLPTIQIKIISGLKMKKIAFSLMAAMVLTACSSKRQPIDPIATAADSSRAKPVAQQPALEQSAVESLAITGFNGNSNVQKFIENEVNSGQFTHQELENFFGGVEYKGNIINIMNRPGTSKPWYQFRAANSGAARINGGKKFYAKNQGTIDAIAQSYGVPAELIVAIIGIETNYGTNSGSFRVADSLSTLAFGYPRRAEYFQQELNEFLLMAKQEKRDIFSFKGSYAGAMGMPQFMPSSFRKYAIDYNKDGFHDIWNNAGDAAASVANYMKAHGWQSGGKMIVPVTLTINQQLQQAIDESTALKHTVAEFKQMGVAPQEYVDDREKAFLYRLETSPGVYEYFLGLNNFYTVWQYNHSRLYVSAVREIANGVSGAYRL